MSKNKKAKVIPMLSPENYIKQKARTLPIHECWINTGWDEDKLANIIVTRKHTNGNFTIGAYLVDLNCLGIKDAQYFFNISSSDYRDILDYNRGNFDIEPAEYTLVHNIVYAGVEYAEDYGFKPHKEFAITQYILEEDTDDIKLMEIECGHNGKPFYIRGPLENEVRARQIVAQLEKTAGPGNYNFIDEIATDDNDWDDGEFLGDEDREDGFDRFDKMKLEEKLKLYIRQLNNIEKLSDEEKDNFSDLSESIINEYLDHDKSDDLYSGFLDEADKFEITDEITDEFLFGCYPPEFDPSEIRMEFPRLYGQLFVDTKEVEAKIKKLQKKYPKTPSLCFLELIVLRTTNFQKYEKTLSAYAEIFPEYSLIKILKQISVFTSEDLPSINFSFEKAIEHFFSGRRFINNIEMFNLLMLLMFRAVAYMNLEEIDAIEYLSEDLGLFEDDEEVLAKLITVAKLNFISSLIDNTDAVDNDNEELINNEDVGYIRKQDFDKNDVKNSQTFQFKIQIKGINKPSVWRRVTVPSYYTFLHFHYLIQAAFEWTNSHLFQFSEEGFSSDTIITQMYDDMDFSNQKQIEAGDIKLSEVFKTEKQELIYIYDLGDSWEHIITLEKITSEATMYPRLLSGKGQCPPEDCGGSWGYESMKEILADRKHPEYESYVEWLGLSKNEIWDPATFNLIERQKNITKIFQEA